MYIIPTRPALSTTEFVHFSRDGSQKGLSFEAGVSELTRLVNSNRVNVFEPVHNDNFVVLTTLPGGKVPSKSKYQQFFGDKKLIQSLLSTKRIFGQVTEYLVRDVLIGTFGL